MINIKPQKSLLVVGLVIFLLTAGPILVQAQETADEIPVEILETPTEAADLVSRFSRVEFETTEIRDGELATDLVVEYQFEGTEEVRGVQTEKISFRGSSEIEPMDVWLNADDGEIVQMKVGGEHIPPGMANMIAEDMFQTAFLPYFYFNRLVEAENLDELEEDRVSRSREKVGDLEVDVFEVDVNGLYGVMSGFVKLADYEDFLIVTDYELTTVEEMSGEEVEIKFSIESLELR